MSTFDLAHVARQVGRDTIAATEASTTLVTRLCSSISTIVQQASDRNLLTAGLGGELSAMHTALGSALVARKDQVHVRLALLRMARGMDVEGFGETCPCGEGVDNNAPTAAAAQPAKLAAIG
jgi:hypothetical protein